MSTVFGDFDPRFPGIALTVGSAERWDQLRRYALGVEVPERLSELDDPAFLDAVSSTTVLPHEVRHFHDFLLSPAGARHMRTRVVLGLNLIQLLVNLRGNGIWDRADALPVPITTWCRMSPGEREAWAAMLTDMGAGLTLPMDFPFLPENPDYSVYKKINVMSTDSTSLAHLITVCEGYRARLIQFEAPPEGGGGLGLTGAHLKEASAFLVQAQEASDSLGQDVAGRFLTLMMQAGNRYGVALHYLGNAFAFAGAPPIADLMAMFTGWVLLGDPLAAQDQAHPLVRFALLAKAMQATGPRGFFGDGDMTHAFARWDELTGQPPTLDSLRRSLDRDERSLASFRESMAHLQPDLVDWVTGFLDGYEEFIHARRLMVGTFLTEPWAYLSPAGYLHNAEHWVAPQLRVTFLGNSALDMGTSLDHGWTLAHGFHDSDGRSIAKVIYTDAEPAGVPCISQEGADGLHSLFAAADVIVGPSPADASEVELLLAQKIIGDDITLTRLY
ncbi:hypothetical protein AB0B89_01445 [Sphaerisporangium sp. NPDC049002]|uniref:hypothetical protein n=1 Tax=Sphaerisporangium sp. NPDC049002 TaxID=3155392 RepID=UPI00340648C3